MPRVGIEKPAKPFILSDGTMVDLDMIQYYIVPKIKEIKMARVSLEKDPDMFARLRINEVIGDFFIKGETDVRIRQYLIEHPIGIKPDSIDVTFVGGQLNIDFDTWDPIEWERMGRLNRRVNTGWGDDG